MLFLLIVSLFSLSFTLSGASADELRIAVFQLEVTEELYESEEAFIIKAEEILEEASEMGADLLILPEYTHALLPLTEIAETVKASDSFEEGIKILKKKHKGSFSLEKLLIRRSVYVRRLMDRIWGEGAVEYQLDILAGTYFAADEDGLYNRGVFYDKNGEDVYVQDKIHLTPFEVAILGIDPGDPDEAALITVSDFKLGFSICRDTFFDDYNHLMEDADIWVDLKANGEEFTDQTIELFERALPAHVQSNEIPWGITACLNGSFLDLLWEGPSSVVSFSEKSSEPEQVHTASSAEEEELLLFTVGQ
jgi:predicted amidohydrolase